MVMKGVGNVLYAIFLAFIFCLLIGSLSLNLFIFSQGQVTEMDFQNRIFTMRNALQACKLYLETSLDYSVYQAMYDNGLIGGFSSDSGSTKDANGLVYWTEPVTQEKVTEDIKSAIQEKIDVYMGDTEDTGDGGIRRTFFDKSCYIPPVTVGNVGPVSSMTSVLIKGADAEKKINIVYEEVSEEGQKQEYISIDSNPDMEKNYAIRYFKLYDQAVNVFNNKGNLFCKNYDTIETDGIETSITINEDKGSTCAMKVVITDKSLKVPVYKTDAASFEYISFVFLIDGVTKNA